MALFFQSANDLSINVNKMIKQAHGGGATWSWRVPFQIFTTLLLSLLLPLSFLLLARLSAARYLFVVEDSDHPTTATTIASFLFVYNGKSVLVYALVSLVTVAAFVHGLTASRLTIIPPREPTTRLYLAWVLLCAFQVCVGLGIEESISAGIDGSGFANESSSNFLIRALLFVGLHETMSFWSRSVVKPVVEDTVRGGGGRWVLVERVGVALSLGALWWWRLREEVDALVVVPELMLGGSVSGRPDPDVGVGVAELVGWWLYYLTVSIGTTRVLKGVVWVGVVLLSSAGAIICGNDIDENEEGTAEKSEGEYDSCDDLQQLPFEEKDMV